jgi:uncharacterized protein YjbI with pentapeptide repeats
MNAVGKCLRDSEFVGQDLSQAVFDGCDLDGVRFCQCDLSNASFKNARLTGMHLDECSIEHADFTDASVNGILGISRNSPGRRENLSEKQLVSTRSYKMKDLRKCIIGTHAGYQANPPPKYDFSGAHLEGAILLGEDFTECDLTDAHIDQIEIHNCAIRFQQVASTKYFWRDGLRRMAFEGVRFEGKVDLSGKNLTGTVFLCQLPNADFEGANITGCTFGPAMTTERLRATKNYCEGNLSGITLIRADLSGCDLSGQNLTGCTFDDCTFAGASLNNAVITNAQFKYKSAGLTLGQIKSTWNYKNKRMEGLVLPKELADALSAAKR